MKKIYIIIVLTVVSFFANGQEFGQNIGAVSVAVEGQKPKDFVYNDEQVSITIQKMTVTDVSFRVKNLTSNTIDFVWSDSYFIVAGQSTPFKDGSNAMELMMGVSAKEVNSVPQNTRIASNTFIRIKAYAAEGYVFNSIAVNKEYKETGEMPVNAAILVFQIDGAKVEKKINFQVYTGRIRRSLKK